MLFIDEKPNMKRQREFDLAKAFTIFVMIAIHIYEEISVVEYGAKASCLFDNILELLAGPTGAPLFMVAMGVGIVYSSHRSPGELALRGLKLFGLSYLLGFLRFGLSYCIASICNGRFDIETMFWLVCNVDILQFAGLSFMLTALLKKLNVPVPAMGAIAVFMQIVGQLLARIEVTSVYGQCLWGLFFYTSDNSCFPLLLWYIFPVAGIIFAKYLRHVSDPDRLYRDLLAVSVTVLAGLCFALHFMGFDLGRFYLLYEDIFYRQDLLSSLVCLCAVMLELSLFHYLLKAIHVSWLENFIHYLGNNLNMIYIFQWIIIGNAEEILYYLDGEYVERAWILPLAVVILGASVGLTALWNRITAKPKKA